MYCVVDINWNQWNPPKVGLKCEIAFIQKNSFPVLLKEIVFLLTSLF
jgi:hypothetical protein